MMENRKIPMGIEDFERIRRDGFYYIDKTKLIRELLEHMAYVNLFTRPRRFGKTLNMSMLKCFFELGSDSSLFDGLDISREERLCAEYMGRFPVIAISLKGVEGDDFEDAKEMLRGMIGKEALRFPFLMESEKLSETERQQYRAMVHVDENGLFTMADRLLKDSLLLLSQFLQKHFGERVIILIDEYDVPLDKAYQTGYYDAMVKLIRILFGQALKTNNSLYFAVLTGCLRISRESIFTGFNNFNVYTIADVYYNEYFGFTDGEVRKLLREYGRLDKYETMKEWYDGYHFGDLEIYCPWDVVSYCHALYMNPSANPQNYWVNTSGNEIVRQFIDRANSSVRNEIEQLVNGGSIRKAVRQELTYRELDSDVDNLWSLLFTTGYLTRCGEAEDGMMALSIPNKEIRWVFVEQIRRWFREETVKDGQRLEQFCRAFLENDVQAIEEGFGAYLKKTISIRDTNVKKEMKENFYHGILLGILGNMDGWDVRSNVESGDGYSDISIEIGDREIGIVIELKYAENAALDACCREALGQILDRNYEEVLRDDGMKVIYRYGIACYKKRCRVISG